MCAVLWCVACFSYNKQYYRTLYYKWNKYKWKPIIMTRKLFFYFSGRLLASYLLFLFTKTGSSWPPALQYNLTARFFPRYHTITYSFFLSVCFGYCCLLLWIFFQFYVYVVSEYVRLVFCGHSFLTSKRSKNQTRWYSTFRYVVYWLI